MPRVSGRRLALVGLAQLGLLSVAAPVAAVPSGWTSPNRVFEASGAPSHSLAIDAEGKVHIATEKGSTGIWYVTNVGGGWSETQISSGDDHEPAIDATNGVVTIAFARRTPGEQGIWTASSDASWTNAQRYDGTASRPALAVFSGRMHIAFRGSGKLRYLKGTDGGSWTREIIDGSCCTGGPAIGLTHTGSPRVAYGDGSGGHADGLKFAVRSSSSWDKRQIQSGRVKHVTMLVNSAPGLFPWDPPSNAPHIAYVRGNDAWYAAKSSPSLKGVWSTRYMGHGSGPVDLTLFSNEFNMIFGSGGKLSLVRMSGGIFFTFKMSTTGNDFKPQMASAGYTEWVTFARDGASNEGIFTTHS